MDAFEKEITSEVPINPQNRRYQNSTSPPSFQPNSDALRLRDENDRLNVKMIETKNEMENQKQMINEQQIRHKELENDVDIGRRYIMRELNPVNYYGKSGGFAYDDDILVSQTDGSDSFEPQTRQPQTAQATRYSAIQDYEDEGILTREEYRQQRDQENAKSFQSPFKDSLAEEDKFAEDNSEPIGKDFGLLSQPSDDEAEGEQLTPQNPQIRIKEKKRVKPTFTRDKEENEDQVPQQNEEENTSMKFPKVDVPKHNNYPFSPEKIPYAKTKPSVVEVQQWKEWYLQLGFKDPSVLNMNTRSSYIKPIQAKLLDEYKKLRGDKDPSILRSKDPRIIYKAIKQRLAGLG